MATYPNFAIDTKNSRQQPIEDLVADQWPNGNSRARSFFTTGKYGWEVTHGVLAEADRATFKTFFDTNKLIAFDFVSPWDGVTYHNVFFVEPPSYERLPGLYWNVKVKFRQFF